MNPVKILVGIVLAFGLGFICRVFTIPAPAPNALIGAVLVMAVTLGYLTADKYFIAQKPAETAAATTTSPGQQNAAATDDSATPRVDD